MRPATILTLLLAARASVQGSPTGLAATVQSGQTFLTWNEVAGAGVKYRVYRSTSPIASAASLPSAVLLGEVGDATSENVRATGLTGATTFFRITDLGPPLAATQGLFVHTQTVAEDAFYAVTSVVGGVENTSIAPGANSLAAPAVEVPAVPRPVLQALQGDLRDYVHWVSAHDSPFAPAMWNAPSRAFNLRVRFDPAASPLPRPVLLVMHARGGNYAATGIPDLSHPEAVILSPDDWIGAAPMNTFWYGMNAGFPAIASFPGFPNVDFTVRRVMAELDFVQAEFPTDPARAYARGGSMGGIGAVFLAYRHPDRFAAAHAVIPKFDFGCAANDCWIEPQAGNQLWGTVAQNLPTTDGIGVYDRLDLGFLAGLNPAVDLPPIFTFNGRNDVVVGWPEKPPTYAAIQMSRQPAEFYWDDGTHGFPNPVGSGPWAQVIGQRRNSMWNLRIDQAVPAFSNLSVDDDPGNGDPDVGDLVGTINGYATWSLATVEDEADHHALVASLRTGPGPDASPAPSATVDWTPRRLQAFPRAPGMHARFSNLQQPAGTLIDDRVVTADGAGVLTVGGAALTTAGNLLSLETIDLSTLPALLATGVVHPGGFLHLNLFGAPAEPTFLFLGLLPASFSVPGIAGTVGIGDPTLLVGAPIGADGKLVVAIPLDPSLSCCVGATVRFQALVSLALTGTEVVTLLP
jgi:S-formylglutathione hydrolase FrmB